jgi:hypothetical protein
LTRICGGEDRPQRSAEGKIVGILVAPDAVHDLSVNRMGALSLALNQVRHAIAEQREGFAVPMRAQFSPRIVRE